MNKLFHKVLKFANQLAGDYYNQGKGKSGLSSGKKDSNVVDIKSRGKKDKDAGQGLTDFSGGAGI